MNFLRNRHMLVAALVAPVLALIAYFAVDHFFGEPPHAAIEGQSYPLVEKPNCRWESGSCGLKNNEFELDMSYRLLGNGRVALSLESSHPLDGVLLAVVNDDSGATAPAPMDSARNDGTLWMLEVTVGQPGVQRMQLAASAGGSVYFGDVSTAFMQAGSAGD